jgi:hypothetical protein
VPGRGEHAGGQAQGLHGGFKNILILSII